MVSSLKIAFGTDSKKEEEGVWIFVPNTDEQISLKIRRFKSRAAKEAATELQKEYRLPKGKNLTQAQTEELVTKLIAKAIIAEWKGVTNTEFTFDEGTGKEVEREIDVECSYENKLAMLLDPAMADFREWVAAQANERDTFQFELDTDAAGN